MDGNDGADTMRGGQHNDTMYGGRYAYPLSGGSFTDTMASEQYTLYDLGDTMYGDSGDDTMYGDAGADVMRGGIGDDTMEGNQDGDRMYGDADHDDMIGGTSRPGVADADDLMHGNAGHDVMAGDNAFITRTGESQDFSAEVTGVPLREVSLYDVAENDSVPLPDPSFSGKDVLWGDTGYDQMYGQGNGEMVAGPVVNLCNELHDDGNGIIDDEDRPGDCMHGGDGPDYMEGNAGDDTMYGDAGEDDMVGGTGRIEGDLEDGVDGRLDGADLMHGGPGFDFMAGDNAVLRRTLVDGQWALAANGGLLHDPIFLRDVNWDDDSHVSGGDEMYGDGQNDVLYGQGSGDILFGGDDHDYLEGNAGSDVMEGNAGQDDLIGGTGLVDHDLPPDQAWFLDAGDWIYGEAGEADGDTDGDGADVMLGDNGTITHPLVDGAWATNSFNGTYTRETFLLDVATLANTPAPGTSGGDHMWGNDNDDLMYGQGGEDEMYGGAGDDYMEGNAASDLMYGNPDDDDMIGGTGRINDDPPAGTPGRIDHGTKTRVLTYAYPGEPPETVTVSLGDQMFGGEGSDVMLGDNGVISRAADTWENLEYRLLADSFGDQAPRHSLSDVEGSRAGREVRMIDPAPGTIAGSDLMFGGPGEDDMYGQFDDSGGLDPQSELIVDATIGDELYGEGGEDAMLGDNGVIENRVLSDPTQEIAPKQPFFDDERFVQGSLFREVSLAFAAAGGHDRLLGGPGGDWMHGGAGNDLMNGNLGNDRLFGDDGDDVLWGGFAHDHVYGGHGKDYLDVKPRAVYATGEKNLLLHWDHYAERIA
jgi:Ca2+-binding RTX toxin-like protein